MLRAARANNTGRWRMDGRSSPLVEVVGGDAVLMVVDGTSRAVMWRHQGPCSLHRRPAPLPRLSTQQGPAGAGDLPCMAGDRAAGKAAAGAAVAAGAGAGRRPDAGTAGEERLAAPPAATPAVPTTRHGPAAPAPPAATALPSAPTAAPCAVRATGQHGRVRRTAAEQVHPYGSGAGGRPWGSRW